MKRNFTILLVVALAFCVGATGCAKKKTLVPVEGTLTLNGEPVEGATVCFVPVDGNVGAAAAGATDSSGHFTVTTGSASSAGTASNGYIVDRRTLLISLFGFF